MASNYRSRSRVVGIVFPYIFTLLVTALTTGLLFVLRSSINPAIVALLSFLLFLVVAVVISQLVGRTRHSLEVATAREHEAIRLYELSQSLSGLRDERGIVQVIAQQTKETFQADRVEVYVEGGKGRGRINFAIPPVEFRGGGE